MITLLIAITSVSQLTAAPYHHLTSELKYKNISDPNGQYIYNIKALVKDSRGFLWIGTSNGLLRWDGINIKRYFYDRDNTNTINSSSIYSITEDEQDNLWIGTARGLCCYIRDKDHFERMEIRVQDQPPLIKIHIFSILSDGLQTIWLGTNNGLYKFDPKTKRTQHFKLNLKNRKGATLDYVYTMCHAPEDHSIWLGTLGRGALHFYPELDCINTTPEIIKCTANSGYLLYNTDNSNIPGDQFREIYIDHQNQVWFGTTNGLGKLDKKTGLITKYNFDTQGDQPTLNKIQSVTVDKDYIYTGNLRQLVVYNQHTEKITAYTIDSREETTNTGNPINVVYKDNNNTIWIGTLHGLFKIPAPVNNFHHNYDHPLTNTQVFNDILKMYEDKSGDIWIGSGRNTLYQYLSETNEIKTYRFPLQTSRSENVYHNKGIYSIYEDSEDVLWIGTYKDGLFRFDKDNECFSAFHPELFNNNAVREITEDARGRLWVLTYWEGANLINEDRTTIKTYSINYKVSDNMVKMLPQCMTIDEQQRVWVGTYHGLCLYNAAIDSFEIYRIDDEDYRYLGANSIFNIFVENDSVLWLGTRGGLSQLTYHNSQNYHFKNWNMRNGLAENEIYHISSDNQGKFWLTTRHGISVFDPEFKTFSNYNQTNGLQKNLYSFGSHFKARNGQLYFGGKYGINIIDLDSLAINKTPSKTIITDFKIFNESVSLGESHNGQVVFKKVFPEARNIKMSYRQHSFTIEFITDNFDETRNYYFAYRLKGFNQNWNILTNQNIAHFTNIHPGEYRFEVKATNDDGIWNNDPTYLNIFISPPFWQTKGFILLVAFIIATILYISYLRFTQSKRVLAQKVIERTRQLSEANELLESKNKSLEQALEEVKTLSGLIPICARCKKIRDDDGYWDEVDSYIKKHSEAKFTHGFCPDCLDELYPKYFESGKPKKNNDSPS